MTTYFFFLANQSKFLSRQIKAGFFLVKSKQIFFLVKSKQVFFLSHHGRIFFSSKQIFHRNGKYIHLFPWFESIFWLVNYITSRFWRVFFVSYVLTRPFFSTFFVSATISAPAFSIKFSRVIFCSNTCVLTSFFSNF